MGVIGTDILAANKVLIFLKTLRRVKISGEINSR